MKRDDAEFRKFIGGWMRSVSNNVSHSFARKLENSGVTVAEWVILRVICEAEHPISPSELANRTGLTRGAVSKLVERAKEKKLVIRKESQKDRRYQEVNVTKKAMKLVPELARLAAQNDEEFFSCLTSLERKTLLRLLKKVATKNELTQIPVD